MMMLAPTRRLLLGAFFLLSPSLLRAQDVRPRDVVINEILYAPSPSQNEFIELYNRSKTTVDLQNFSFSDDREIPTPITNTQHLVPPGAYVVLVRDAAHFEAAFPGVSYVAPPEWDALNNGGDAAVLYRGATEIDRVPYRPSWGGADGRSLERIDPAGPSDRPSNFGPSTAPSGATPAAQNSVYAPDDAPPVLTFTEVTASDTVVAHFDEPIAPSTSAASFALDDERSPVEGERSEDGTRMHLAFEHAVTGLRLHAAGVRDLVGNTQRTASTLLGYPPAAGDLAINEIMYDPRADDYDEHPNQPEYIEFANRSDHALSLRGLFWTDRPDETGHADTTRFGDVHLLALPPGGFAVVFAASDSNPAETVASALSRAFPAIDVGASSVVLLPYDAATLGLRNDGDLVRLHAVRGMNIDEVRYTPDWHAPHVIDAKGTSLERISLTAPTQAATNWTSSVALHGGTPGRANSVFLTETAPSDNTIIVAPSPFSPDGDGFEDATRIQYRLDANVALVRARIYDALGRPVRTLEESRLVTRTGEFLWDGRGDDGQRLRIGIYVVLFEALDAAGGRVISLKHPVVLARPLN